MKTIEQRRQVYVLAQKQWGKKAQMEMAQEEATELALAIRKQIRKNDDITFANLVEEVADMEIMIEQIDLMHGESFRQLVDFQKEFKVERLAQRVNKNTFE